MNHEPLVEVLHAVDFELLALVNVLAVEEEHFDWLQLDEKMILNEKIVLLHWNKPIHIPFKMNCVPELGIAGAGLGGGGRFGT